MVEKNGINKHVCSVLLVDDSSDVAALVKAYLADPRISLTVSAGGKEGIETFKNGCFDLVLMDVEMPGVDGNDATKAIRFWETRNDLRPTPIAALTALESPAAVSEMFSSGCTQYLRKPITKNTLLQTVAQYFASNYDC
jgi:two-component system, NarL family, sensor histidine kinase BarA